MRHSAILCGESEALMKLSNKMIMGALWLFHCLCPPVEKVEEIYAHAKKHNERQVFKLPRNRWGLVYKDLEIRTQTESYHCLRMKKKGQNPDRAILYIGGGGGVITITSPSFSLLKNF